MMRFKDSDEEIDNRIVIVYQNKRTGREHNIVVQPEEVEKHIEYHLRMGHMVSTIPLQLLLEQKDV